MPVPAVAVIVFFGVLLVAALTLASPIFAIAIVLVLVAGYSGLAFIRKRRASRGMSSFRGQAMKAGPERTTEPTGRARETY